MTSMTSAYVRRCAIAGIIWGTIAYFLGARAFGWLIFVGIAASPFIGVAVGAAVLTLKEARTLMRIVGAGLSLYASAVIFACVIGVVELFTRAPNHNSEVFFQPVLAVLWGLTFTGYFVMLWPIAFLTQEWVLSHSSDNHSAA